MKTTVISVADDMHIKCVLHADSSLFSHGSVFLASVAGCESPAQPPSVPDASRAPPESIRLILTELHNQTSSSEGVFTPEPVSERFRTSELHPHLSYQPSTLCNW